MLNGKINVMMSGLPGKMATKVAEKVIEQEDINLNDYSFTGDINQDRINNLKMFHIVYGRDIYASGTLDAIRFLHKKIKREKFTA